MGDDTDTSGPELEGVKRAGDQLEQALDEVAHELRRCRDALERDGWRSRRLEQRERELSERRRMLVEELERVRKRVNS